jgi:hypothetical protein
VPLQYEDFEQQPHHYKVLSQGMIPWLAEQK